MLAENWTAAIATAGGTPAAPNSVEESMPDLRGPELLMVYALDSLQLKASFSEALDTSRLSPENFTFNPSLPLESVEVVEQNQLLLQLEGPLVAGEEYNLLVENITDCSGNIIEEASSEAMVVYPRPAGPGDVLMR